MATILIKGNLNHFATFDYSDSPQEGEFIHIPEGKFFKLISNSNPHNVEEVKNEDIPKDAKIYFLRRTRYCWF